MRGVFWYSIIKALYPIFAEQIHDLKITDFPADYQLLVWAVWRGDNGLGKSWCRKT